MLQTNIMNISSCKQTDVYAGLFYVPYMVHDFVAIPEPYHLFDLNPITHYTVPPV